MHTATIDLSSSSVSLQNAQFQIAENGGTVVDVTGDVITATFERSAVRAKFIAALQEVLRKTNKRRRWHVSEANVDTALGNGGIMTITPAQMANALLDKAS